MDSIPVRLVEKLLSDVDQAAHAKLTRLFKIAIRWKLFLFINLFFLGVIESGAADS